MSGNLFRREVIESQQINRQTGEILLIQSLPLWYITLGIVIAALTIILFLSFAEFTRKERVFGLTVPGHGAIRLTALDTGIIYASHVTEGSHVSAGDLLFEIRQEKFSDLGDTQKLIQENLADQSDKLVDEIRNRVHQAQLEAASLKNKSTLLEQEIASLKAEIALQVKQVTTKKRLAENLLPLYEKRIIPELQYQQQVSEHIEQQTRLETLKRSLLALKSRHNETINEIRSTRLRAEADQSALERTLLSTRQQNLVQRGSHLNYIRAPVAGIVSNILVDAGRQIEAGESLATLLPQGVNLDIQVFIPSNAIGFLKNGQQVKLRYDAFPYQKFGVYAGELTELTHIDVSLQEMQLRFPHLMEKYQGMTFFRATVRPESQTIQAYGKQVSLKAGLTLEADIHLERKRLIEWVFDPVLALGRSI
ncbi:MAG: HlyD family efflux transporter periplasmic adaptor subunit [Candidatus Thiodiazotropha sp.]|jgi:membrane fusion protein